jgi:hypothetical protein
MTNTSKSTDSQSRELSLTDLDQVSGGDLSTKQKAVLVAVAVTTVAMGPVASGLFLGTFLGALAAKV